MDRTPLNGSSQAAPRNSSNFVPALSNFSIQYNLSAASIALALMQAHPYFKPPAWVHYVLLGLVFAGAVLGMLVMGYLGDLLGRRRAMVVTMGFQVFGALGCACLTIGTGHEHSTNIYTIFCACRFLLGIGVGGMWVSK